MQYTVDFLGGNNKRSDRSMQVELPSLLGNFDRQTNRQADRRA